VHFSIAGVLCWERGLDFAKGCVFPSAAIFVVELINYWLLSKVESAPPQNGESNVLLRYYSKSMNKEKSVFMYYCLVRLGVWDYLDIL